MKHEKIGVIGAGHVGSHVANALLLFGVCDEIVLLDTDSEKALAQAMDLADTAVCLPRRTAVKVGCYADLADADLVVFCAFSGTLEADRLAELQNTAAIARQVGTDLVRCGFGGLIVSITNPCDIIAQLMQAVTGLTVIGTGTALDSARLRQRIARQAGVAACEVDAFVIGEHGDSQVPVLSSATIGGRPVGEFCTDAALAQAALDTVSAGWDIAKRKGSTEFGIGAVAATICRAILRDERRVYPCSAMLQGEEGQQGVFASLPRVLGAEGVLRTAMPELNCTEAQSFARSCAILRERCGHAGLPQE